MKKIILLFLVSLNCFGCSDSLIEIPSDEIDFLRIKRSTHAIEERDYAFIVSTYANNDVSAPNATVRAVHAEVEALGAGLSDIHALVTHTSSYSSDTIYNAAGLHVGQGFFAGGGVVREFTGIDIYNQHVSESQIYNQYGIFIRELKSGNRNYGIFSEVQGLQDWNIYTSGFAPNYFNGDVRIGTTNNIEKLTVNGAIAIGNSAEWVRLFVDDGELKIMLNNGNIKTIALKD